MTTRHFTSLDRSVSGHVLRIAHRGASAYARENAAGSLKIAADMHADMVEIDVRITADDRPVISHDDTLKRLYNIPAAISDLTLRDLGSAIPSSAEPILTFEEVALSCVALRLGLYLDLKAWNEAAARIIFRTLDSFELTDYTIVGSFRPDWLAEVKSHRPHLRTSVLFSSLHVDPVAFAQSVKANYVHPCWENAAPEPHLLLTEAWMGNVRGAKLGIVTWHEERPAEITALNNLGVDGICSDTPDVLYDLTANRAAV
jgi:glycerophosphoryl diester phosphodiesterase